MRGDGDRHRAVLCSKTVCFRPTLSLHPHTHCHTPTIVRRSCLQIINNACRLSWVRCMPRLNVLQDDQACAHMSGTVVALTAVASASSGLCNARGNVSAGSSDIIVQHPLGQSPVTRSFLLVLAYNRQNFPDWSCFAVLTLGRWRPNDAWASSVHIRGKFFHFSIQRQLW